MIEARDHRGTHRWRRPHSTRWMISGEWFAASLLAMSLTAVGCGDGEVTLGRVAVSGQVTLDGAPLEAGAIVFRGPIEADQASTVIAYGQVKDGRYRIDADQGPCVGTARVMFFPKPLAREELEGRMDEASHRRRGSQNASVTVVEIPPQYGEASPLRADLSDQGENIKNFALESR